MRVLAIVLGALALMSATAWIMRHEPSVARRGGERPTTARAQREDTQELALLRGEVRALRVEVQSSKALALARVEEAAEPRGAAAPTAALFDAEQAAASRAEALQSRFESEALDPRWSSEAARDLQGVFAGGVIAGTQLVMAECRATLCRVQLRHDDEATRLELAPQIAEKGPFAAGVYYAYSPDDARETTLYVSRSGK